MTGKRFGRLVALRRTDNKGRQTQWLCRCDCGTVRPVLGSLLRGGLTTSCGCFMRETTGAINRTHGRSKTRTYKIWKGMRGRCQCPSNTRWAYYGGRGITVDPRWDNYDAFLEDMGECPPGKSLERIDNSRGYGPDNCRWATLKEQARNQRTNRMIECRGEKKCLAEWCEITGLHHSVIRSRLRLGWSVEDALFKPCLRRTGPTGGGNDRSRQHHPVRKRGRRK
jgi:hypothetical protein